jgi:hypothetical protein
MNSVDEIFAHLSPNEQQRLLSLNPTARLSALRNLEKSTQQPTQPAQQAIKFDLPSGQLITAESYAKSLPFHHRLALENLPPARRTERTLELKEYFDRTGRFPGS